MSDLERMAAAAEMRRLLYGQLLASALRTAAELRLPDALAEGPQSAEALARRTATEPAALTRLMQCLAAFDIFRQHPDGTFGLAPLGETLCSDAPGSALPTALLISAAVGPAWERLGDAVRTGQPSFLSAFGEGFFTRLDDDPGLREIFDRSQEEGLSLELPEVLAHLDLTGLVVDVGGGDGALLAALLTESPSLRGVLVERASALRRAERRMAKALLTERCELHEGDFFTMLPPHGDAYILRHILHDWDDKACLALLEGCRRAMSLGGRVIVIEHLAGEADSRPAALMDLYMMSVVPGGRERSRAEFAELFARSGFELVRTRVLSTGAGLLEARPADFEARPADARSRHVAT